MKKFLIKILFFAVMLAAMSQPAMGQVKYKFVGENQTILLDSETKTVTLGDPGNSSDDSKFTHYHWSIVDHPDDDAGTLKRKTTGNPKLTVSKEGTYILECVRVSKYGYQVEYVAVDVRGSFDIVSAENRYSCYSQGDAVDISDFDIVTDPPGYEHLVKLMPGDDKAAMGFVSGQFALYDAKYFKPVHFYFEMTDGTQHIPEHDESEIVIVNSNTSEDDGWGFPRGSQLLNFITKAEKFDDIIRKSIGKKEAFLSINIEVRRAKSADCCDHRYETVRLVTGAITSSAGLDFPYPIPFCPNLVFHVKPTVDGSVTFAQLPLTGCRDASFWPVFKSKLGVTSGLELTLIPGTSLFAVEGDYKLYGSIESPLNDPINGAIARIGVSVALSVTAIVTLYSTEYVLAEAQFSFSTM